MPALKIDRGLPRLRALFERWLDWTLQTATPRWLHHDLHRP